MTEAIGRPRDEERKKRLRIAFCHPDLGIGGAERLVVDAALELSRQGHDVHLFTAHHDPNRCFEETVDGSFPVTVYGDFLPRHVFHHLHALCAYIRCMYVALCMVLFWPRFDVIFADQVSAVIPVLKLKTSSKILFYCHFPDLLLAQHTTHLRKLYRAPLNWIEETTTGMADRVLVNSEFTALTFGTTFKQLHARGLNPTVLYPAVDIYQFHSDAQKIPPNIEVMCIFLSINRFERKKNIGLAISAFASLLRKQENISKGMSIPGQDVRLVIAGGYDQRLTENWEYLQELKSLALQQGVGDQVVFVPSCSTLQRNTLLAACLCVIYTPMNEHFGIVPLEAMAAEKPVVACNSGGPKESVKHAATGFLCEPTPESFASAMMLLLHDPQKAEMMGKFARQHVEENFSRKVFGAQLNTIIYDLLKPAANFAT
ncbi:unnamed protein product [Sphagnum jensenii]|uniref:Alpha-1,3/1,6-mannosyltransferase ALG2 n=1 Tax=Sphagnum jensenii TaxID=128206 RepID=A0ABP0WRU1_9BRYO